MVWVCWHNQLIHWVRKRWGQAFNLMGTVCVTIGEVIFVFHKSYVRCPNGKLGLQWWCSLGKGQLGLFLEDQTEVILGWDVRVAPVLGKAKLEVGSVMAKKDLKGGVAEAFPWCVPVLGSLCEGNRTAEEKHPWGMPPSCFIAGLRNP